MLYVRKMQAVAIAAAAVFCLTAAEKLAAQDTAKARNVIYHVGGGNFAAPPISGNDLLELEGNPFMVSVIASKDSKPVKHGKGYAIYHNIEMQGAVTSTMNPTKPFKIHSKHGILILALGDPNFDEIKYTCDVTVTGLKLTVVADVHMPKGTLAGFEIKPLNNSVTFSNSTTPPLMTVTYKNSSASTVLGVSTGTLTGTVGKP